MARRRRREPETATIVSVTHDGRGIADTGGKKVFVSGALEGERVRFQRRKFRRKFDEAELLEVLEASSERIDPRCAVYGRCGGCVMQHVSEEHQRAVKLGSLRDSMQRIGRVEPAAWLDALHGPSWNYRRRARLAVKDVTAKDRVLVGFRERHAPYVTDMRQCEVLAEPVGRLIESLAEMVAGLSVRARLPQIEVAVADNAVALVFRVLDAPSADDRRAFEQFGHYHKVRVYLQSGGTDSVELLHPADEQAPPLYYRLPEFDVEINFDPVGFVQVNGSVNEQMVSLALELLDPSPDDRVLDLFCGIGNFSLPLGLRSSRVLGVEGDADLVSGARSNAVRNGLSNVDFLQSDLEQLNGSETWLREGWDRMLLDPARSGAEAVARCVDVPDPERIVYVSCHPGTLARDAGILVHEKGYRCEAAGIIDMFPHTAHVESIAVFNKR